MSTLAGVNERLCYFKIYWHLKICVFTSKTIEGIQIFRLFLHSVCDAVSGRIWNPTHPLYTQSEKANALVL